MNANKHNFSRLECEIPDLRSELLILLNQIPPGRITTYGKLAEALGSRQAAVWVGEYMLHHPHPDGCPCHRVVRYNGELGRYITGNLCEQEHLLLKESVDVHNGCVNLRECLFDSFRSDKPLSHLAEFQTKIPAQVRLKPFRRVPEVVAGVDVSYASGESAVGACALMETESSRLIGSTTVQKEVGFPYISGFLAFREIPVLLELYTQTVAAYGEMELILVDGNGILHRRGAGIATHLGLLIDRPTIGIGKKLLCGRVDLSKVTPQSPQPVIYEERVVGMAMKSRKTSRPIFISPGHLIDVESAMSIVNNLFHGHRLPEPVYQADKISRQVAQEYAINT